MLPDQTPGVHIGTSGWSYDHWQEVLYPPGTPVRERLEIYTRAFSTVELNASFYRWPAAAVWEGWRRRLPGGFLLTAKAPRALTHLARLSNPERWVPRLAHDLARLGDRLGVLLVQLPPDFEPDLPRLEHLLASLPPRLRVAVEARHPTWHTESLFALLERYSAAYCVMSGARLPCILRATAPFVYLRMHGPHPERLYADSYSDADLTWWADRIGEWRDQPREVFVYFNNDGYGHAVRNARSLRALLA